MNEDCQYLDYKLEKGMAGLRMVAVQPGSWHCGFWQKSSNQSGATLFTALIFLIMLIFLGASAAQMSGLEERMAGNARNRNLAFQAAEAALADVKNTLASGKDNSISGSYSKALKIPADYSTTTLIGSGLRTINTCLPNTLAYWTGMVVKDCGNNDVQFIWSTDTPAQNPTASYLVKSEALDVAAQPMYVVERYPDVPCPGSTSQPPSSLQQYRVTARGVGGDNNAVVILQAMFTVCY